MDLNGTSAIVTGGASGIGLACAKRLTSEGARVVVLDMNEAKGTAVAKELGGAFAKADVADEAQVQAAVDAATKLGPLRALVNAAGVGHAMRTVDREGKPFDLAAFERVLRINLVGTFNCIRLAAAAMSKTAPVDADGDRGAIVNTASVAAEDGQMGQAAYSASKAAIAGMTLTIARDLMSEGIRVNTILPGLIDTKLAKAFEGEEMKKILTGTPLRRIGQPEEIGYAVLYLSSPAGAFVTGASLVIDGGASIASH